VSAPRCRCDGRYDGCEHGRGGCDGAPGTPWGPYFCAGCDPRRLAHISANLSAIVSGEAAEPVTTEGEVTA
jgi:hypothetical protein